MGSSSLFQKSGTDIAGWPVALNNGVYGAKAFIRSHAFMGLAAEGKLRGKSNSEPVRVCTDFFKKRAPRRRRPVWIADIRPGGSVQKGSAVSYRAGNRMLADETGEQISEIRAQRIAPPRGLEAE